MYITCEQCSTIFRLDENLLNPNGSKVRCSQCRNVFVAKPPVAAAAQTDDFIPAAQASDMNTTGFAQEADQVQDTFDQDTFDKELEGIDFAELDSIMGESRSVEPVTQIEDSDGIEEVDPLVDFDESDLDMDFESALDQGGGISGESTVMQAAQRVADPLGDISENIDFDMDFELDEWDAELVEPAVQPDEDDLEAAMDMDFDLDGTAIESEGAGSFETDDIAADDDLTEQTMLDPDVELALDDFEDVLGGAEGREGRDLAAAGMGDEDLDLDLTSEDTVFEDSNGAPRDAAYAAQLDEGAVEAPEDGEISDIHKPFVDGGMDIPMGKIHEKDATTDDIGASDDLDLTGMDAFLDEEESDFADPDTIAEDVELSLDPQMDVPPQPAAGEIDPGGAENDETLEFEELDALLDEDDATIVVDESIDAAPSPNDDLELSLDDAAAMVADDEEATVLAGEEMSDDLELGDLDALLDGDDASAAIGSEPADAELSLDDDMELSLDDAATMVADDEEATVLAGEQVSDDLDALLDGDDDAAVAGGASADAELSLDEDMELSLDDDATIASDDEEATVLAGAEAGDDLELGDLDALLEGDDASAAAGDESADLELSLDDDMELSLDDDATVVDDIEEVTLLAGEDEGDDLDLGDLDALLDGDDESAEDEPVGAELSLDDDMELNLDDDTAIIEDGEEATVLAGREESDDLDLGDLDALLEGDDASADAVAGGDSAYDELSFDDDMELSLDDDAALIADDEEATVLAGGEGDDALDLGDLDALLSDDESPDAGLSLDDDSTLILEDDAVDADQDAGEFDLSDLEGMLDDDADSTQLEDAELSMADDALEFSMDDDLELSMDDETEDGRAPDHQNGDLEDLELELDSEFDDKTIVTDDVAGDDIVLEEGPLDEALDLSDIEKMLEDDTIVADTADVAATTGIDTDDAERWADEAGSDLSMEDDEIDLTEIEEALDSDPGAHDDLFAADGQELELELDVEPEEAQGADGADAFELELEMEDSASPEPAVASMDDDRTIIDSETIDGGDIQLEFQIEDTNGLALGGETEPPKKDGMNASVTSGFMQQEADFSDAETIAAEPVIEKPEIGMTPVPKKSRGSRALLFIILFLLLAVLAALIGYNYAAKQGIRIPVVSDYLNPKPADPAGVLKLDTIDVHGNFIINKADGQLFVVRGNVRNGYSEARKLIRLECQLINADKAVLKTEKAVVGLVLSDQELSSLSTADIKLRLNTTTGKDSAITVAEGMTAPFMVVFSKLPNVEEMDEYEIVLESSIKAQ